jgi:hypothetical protein
MLDQLIPWTAPTAYGLLGLAVLLVLFGFLVPIRQVRRELQREREIAEHYRRTAEAQDARADRLMELLGEALRQRVP